MNGQSGQPQLHIIILGGGPAGSACGLALLRQAARMGKPIRVTLIESKQFSGEQAYNQCVGVLSPPLPELMADKLQLPFPTHLTRALISGYVLHGQQEELTLDDDQEPSLALRRIQFDSFMLESAAQAGVEILPARATNIEFHADQVVVYTDSVPIQGDLLVGAFGMDEGTAAIFSRQTDYQPPSALYSVVTKVHPGDQEMARFGQRIHAFLPRHRRIEFGGITPKGNHLTINIAGREVDAPLMAEFLSQPQVRSVLPNFDPSRLADPDDLRYFKGRFPYSLAHNYFGDRFVLIGDAAGLVRSFKGKGVTTAVQTGIRAAETILNIGFSSEAFDAHYRRANQDLTGDVTFGQAMRLAVIALARSGMLEVVIRAARNEPRLRHALFGAVSGHEPYRGVWKDSLSPASLFALLRALAGSPPRPAEPTRDRVSK